MNEKYAETVPSRAQIDATEGALLLEFGAPWCGFCRAAQPLIAEAMKQAGEIPHEKIEDGKGRPLGRSFRVKLWPTLIFLRDGHEAARLVRPDTAGEIREALERIR